MKNTKLRHAEIYAAAVAVLAAAGGVEKIDFLDQLERPPRLRQLYRQVVEATGCHPDTAKRNVAKAMRRARYSSMQKQKELDDLVSSWGGAREGAGRPKEDKKMTTVVNSVGKAVDYDAAVNLMDDDIREDLHAKLAPCTEQEFFKAYAKAHQEKYGEKWEPDKSNPVW